MADYAELSRRFQDALGMKGAPVGFYYANDKPDGALGFKGVRRGSCIVALAYQASTERPAAFDKDTHGCPGAGRFLGFKTEVRKYFAEFLSCGFEDVVEGERYIKTPALAKIKIERQRLRQAPARYAVFSPLDKLPAGVEPEVVIFFAPPDVLSGLVVLADYDNERPDSNTVVRFSSGCGQIVAEPLAELATDTPRALLGMFDPSARPQVPRDVLSYAIPRPLFLHMADNIDGSFLQTETWQVVKKLIAKQTA
jgi:uncharacterized protein (DUF169 family)